MRNVRHIVLLASVLAVLGGACYAESLMFDLSGPLGGRLNHHDLKAMAAADQPLLTDDTLALGATREWSNPASGDHGTVQLVKRFEYTYEGNKLPCRELRYHTVLANTADPYNYTLNRCKVADGSWKTL